MQGIIAKKIGMTSIYTTEGTVSRQIPCTVIETGACIVTQVKTNETDGYEAIQLGYGEKKEKSTNQPMLGHFKKAGTTPKHKLVEFRDFDKEVQLGEAVKAEDIFEEGDFVDVVGTSKGKGFQGVVKRYNFRGVGDSTHGQHNRQRHPGSIGACSTPSRVFKGLKMAGRMGNDRVKVQNLKVLKIMPEKNAMVISGAIPGARTSFIIIEK